jgi:hypothetical protein
MKTYRFAILCSLLGLVGCTAINSTSFTNMSSAYRDVVEEYSNTNILLNIVRASKDMPMSFLDIPSVIGTGNVLSNASVTTSQSAGTFATPPSVIGGSLGLTVNNGFTFTQASLDNAQFMGSFLKEIPLNILGFKGTERLLPKAVSYSILIESIELRSNNALVHRFDNDPLDRNYEDFQQILYLLIDAGLTVENATDKTPLGPPIEKSSLNRSLESWGPSTIDGMAKGSLSLDKIMANGREMYQLNRTETTTRACVNKYRAEQLLGDALSLSAYCKDSLRLENSKQKYSKVMQDFVIKNVNAKNMELAIGIRSPGNAFDFLGSVLNAQFDSGGSKLVMIKPSPLELNRYGSGASEQRPLFKVYRNANFINPVAVVSYKGVNYSVPDDDGSYTKNVLEFMSTLVTMAKIPGSVPSSPAVIVR